jgi:hypothetical protein
VAWSEGLSPLQMACSLAKRALAKGELGILEVVSTAKNLLSSVFANVLERS